MSDRWFSFGLIVSLGAAFVSCALLVIVRTVQ